MLARESVSVVEWLEHLLHPWTSFVIVPLFALANAGIPLSSHGAVATRASSRDHLRRRRRTRRRQARRRHRRSTWLAVRLRIGVLPDGVATGAASSASAALAGIGFTVSIFVAGLAFDDTGLQNEAKVGILAASAIAAAVGSFLLFRAGDAPHGGRRRRARRVESLTARRVRHPPPLPSRRGCAPTSWPGSRSGRCSCPSRWPTPPSPASRP